MTGVFGRISEALNPSKRSSASSRPDAGPAPREEAGVEMSISLVTDEVIPAERRMTPASQARSGLYPHEILLLDYASSMYPDQKVFQGFWWFRYGVRDPGGLLRSLTDRGLLSVGDIEQALMNETVASLKIDLREFGLPLSGKKDALVQRLLSDAPRASLEERHPRRTYALTEQGREALEAEPHVAYIHTRTIDDLDIWSFSGLVHSNPGTPWRDLLWGHLNQRGLDHASRGDWGLFGSTRLAMAKVVLEEGKHRVALDMLADTAYFDLSGLTNNWDLTCSAISEEDFFPYCESSATIPPGVTRMLIDCQEALNLSSEELRGLVLARMRRLSAPFHLFTAEECVDVVMYEIQGDEVTLSRIYEQSRSRMRGRYPESRW